MSSRVFVCGVETDTAVAWLHQQGHSWVDVCICCGQGCYHEGAFHSEFHDRGTYLRHALELPEVCTKYGFNCAVLSGGFTQAAVPWISEADSILRILIEIGRIASPLPLILNESALDTSENLLHGLMSARLALGDIPIRRIGIWAAWNWKQCRLMRNSQALGIEQQTYFFGLAHPEETNVCVAADRMTPQEFQEDMVELSLLRTPKAEEKRQKRWQNNHEAGISGYSNRLAPFAHFTQTWAAISKLESLWQPAQHNLDFAPEQREIFAITAELKAAFRAEVIEGKNAV